MRSTNEHRRQRKRGKVLPERPPEKNRLYDETFGIVEKVEIFDEASIPVRIAEKRGYLTRGQIASILGITVAQLRSYINRSRYERRSPTAPAPIGRLQIDRLRTKGNGAYLYDRAEMLTWLRAHPYLKKRLPQELRRP